MHLNELSYVIIGKSIEIHKILGPGLLEKTYHTCLAYELMLEGLRVESELSMPVVYKEIQLEHGYRIDLLVEEIIVVEIKCVEKLLPIHTAQTLTYLKLGGFQLGLLINFHTKLLKDVIRRFKY